MCASWKSAQQQAGIVAPWHNESIGSMRSNCWNTISNSFRKIPSRENPSPLHRAMPWTCPRLRAIHMRLRCCSARCIIFLQRRIRLKHCMRQVVCPKRRGDASGLSYGFVRGEIDSILEDCGLNPETFDAFPHPWGIFKLNRKEDIDRLRSNFDVTPLHLVASDGYANHMRSTVDQMDDRMYALYLKYHFATCERQDMMGYSHHILDIFQKN